MKKITILFCCCLSILNQACASSGAEIKAINEKVAEINKMKDDLNALELKLHTGEFESVPPEVKYYYLPDNLELVMLEVSVGHETFVTKHSYYFSHNLAIKYIKEILHRADNPPKQAIIFDSDGTILWKNMDEPVMDSSKVIELFNLNMNALKAFAKY